MGKGDRWWIGEEHVKTKPSLTASHPFSRTAVGGVLRLGGGALRPLQRRCFAKSGDHFTLLADGLDPVACSRLGFVFGDGGVLTGEALGNLL